MRFLKRYIQWVFIGAVVAVFASAAVLHVTQALGSDGRFVEEEIGFTEQTEAGETLPNGEKFDTAMWSRPEGRMRVGLQVGHWKNEEVPEELEGLKRNGAGAVGGGMNERDAMFIIVERAAALLGAEGIAVDILPATIPPSYYADVFVAVHADGNGSPAVSGYKLASPRRDYSGRALELERSLAQAYGEATGLSEDSNVTRRMRGYYAFNWRRYVHALHPMTPAVILETGFMTSYRDQRVLLGDPDRAAEGIMRGVLDFLQQ